MVWVGHTGGKADLKQRGIALRKNLEMAPSPDDRTHLSSQLDIWQPVYEAHRLPGDGEALVHQRSPRQGPTTAYYPSTGRSHSAASEAQAYRLAT
jgi:hypothetical protein